MELPSDNQLDRIEKKLNQLLQRKRTARYMEKKRQNELVQRRGNQIKQLKVDKIALVNYIKELEKFNNLPTS